MPAPPPADQFWLLTGEVPSGPLTVAQVHAELAAGRATWQTPACPVGGATWLPLVQTPGIGPPALPRTAADARPPAAPPSSVAVATTPSIDEPASEGVDVATAATPASARRTTPSPDAPPAESPYIPAATPRPAQPQVAAEPVRTTAAPTDERPSKPNGSNRFWLLVGAETIGPFRVADIRYKLQAGELTPDAKARRVGTEEWVALTDAVGTLPPRLPVGPKAPPSGDAAPAEKPAPRQRTVAPEAPPGGGSTAPIEVRCGCGRLARSAPSAAKNFN
jgi:hypothetical protein